MAIFCAQRNLGRPGTVRILASGKTSLRNDDWGSDRVVRSGPICHYVVTKEAAGQSSPAEFFGARQNVFPGRDCSVQQNKRPCRADAAIFLHVQKFSARAEDPSAGGIVFTSKQFGVFNPLVLSSGQVLGVGSNLRLSCRHDNLSRHCGLKSTYVIKTPGCFEAHHRPECVVT